MAKAVFNKRILLVFLILIIPFLFGIAYFVGFNQKAQAAITLDTKSQSGIGTNTLSWQHTVNTNTNQVLIVGVTTRASSSSPPSAVTYNGIALTRYASNGCVGSLGCNASMWYLVNPAAGTHTITVTSANSSVIKGGAATYYNVNLASPFGGYTPNSGLTQSQPGATKTVSFIVSGTTTSDVVIDVLAETSSNGNTPSSYTPGTGQTVITQNVYQNGSINLGTFMSAKQGITGTTSSSWTFTNVTEMYFAGIGVRLAGLPNTPTPTPTLTPTPTSTPTPTPTPTPITYSITGNIYNDLNNNDTKDASETNYTGTPSIAISPNAGTITTTTDGTYSIVNLPAGTYTVSMTSLPQGYHMIYPLNGPPPSFQVTVGPGCNTNGAQGASCQ